MSQCKGETCELLAEAKRKANLPLMFSPTQLTLKEIRTNEREQVYKELRPLIRKLGTRFWTEAVEALRRKGELSDEVDQLNKVLAVMWKEYVGIPASESMLGTPEEIEDIRNRIEKGLISAGLPKEFAKAAMGIKDPPKENKV